MKLQKKAWKGVLGLLMLWFLSHVIISVVDGLRDTKDQADVAIILGSKVEVTGQLSTRLEARVLAGLSAYKRGQVSKLLVSGGLGKEGHNEAEVMKQFLVEKGVPSIDVLLDSKGNTTELTAINSKAIMTEANLSSAIIVSHYFHLSRAKMACRRAGIEVIGGVHAPMSPQWREVYSIPREFIGYYVYFLRMH